MKRKFPPARDQGLVISGIDPQKVSFADMAKKLKNEVNLDTLGVKITAMWKTKSGAMALFVGRGEDRAMAADKLRVAVEVVLGTDAGVRIRSNTLRLQLLGICGDDDPTNICSGFIRGVSSEQLAVKWTRPDRWGKMR